MASFLPLGVCYVKCNITIFFVVPNVFKILKKALLRLDATAPGRRWRKALNTVVLSRRTVARACWARQEFARISSAVSSLFKGLRIAACLQYKNSEPGPLACWIAHAPMPEAAVHAVHFVSSSIVKQRRLGLAEALECEAI